MEKHDKLRRYLKKDYTEVVEFPVELVDRDGVVRHYSFEESLEVYHRRIQTAPWRYDDGDLVAAEIDHCTKRIKQIERSFLLRRHGGGTVPLVTGARPDAKGLAVLDRFYRVSLAERGYLLEAEQAVPLALEAAEGGDPASVWRVAFGDPDERHLFYVYPFGGEAGDRNREAYRTFVQASRAGAAGAPESVERLLFAEETAAAGYALTGRNAVPDALVVRALTTPGSPGGTDGWAGGADPGESVEGAARTPTAPDPDDEGDEWAPFPGDDSGEEPAWTGSGVFDDSDEGEADEAAGPEADGDEDDTDGGPAPERADGREEREPEAPGSTEFAEAVARLRRGDAEGATEGFRLAVARNPWSREGYRVLITLLDAAGKHGEAELYARMAERHLPDDAVVLLHGALNQLRQGHQQAALLGLDRALALDPSLQQARYFAGLVRAVRGELGAARGLLERCTDEESGPRVRLALHWIRRQERAVLGLRLGVAALGGTAIAAALAGNLVLGSLSAALAAGVLAATRPLRRWWGRKAFQAQLGSKPPTGG